MLTTPGHVAQILLLVAFIFLILLKDRISILGRWFSMLLGVLAVVALLAHLEFLSGKHFHIHEFYHYYINTKYFPELGYTGLYEATVVADFEDDPTCFLLPDRGVRSLLTYEVGPRSGPLERENQIRARFSPERWLAFKSDIAYFRKTDGVLWRMGDSLRDHGYNGSPLVTAVLGGLAQQPFLSTPSFIRIARWFDVTLLIVATLIIMRWIGPDVGLLFLFLWAVNPFNDHAYIGGAYLRYLSFLGLAVALLAYLKGRYVVSGAAFAVASLLRGFPVFLIAGLFLQNSISRERRSLLRRHAPLFTSAAATVLILVAATSFIPTPDGRNVWSEFARKISLHSHRASPNVVGLRYLFFYSEAHNVPEIERSWQDGRKLDWVVETRKTFAQNRNFYFGTLAAVGLVLLFLLRGGRPVDGLFAGLVLVFAWLHLAHYHYGALALIPFIYPRRREGLMPLTVFWIVVAAACLLPRTIAVLDYRFYVVSVLMGLYFIAILALRLADRYAPVGMPEWANFSGSTTSPRRRQDRATPPKGPASTHRHKRHKQR